MPMQHLRCTPAFAMKKPPDLAGVIYVPFQSHQNLAAWYQGATERARRVPGANPDADRVEALYGAMRHWFGQMPCTIRVWDHDLDPHVADVHMEFYVDGVAEQWYLFSLVTPAYVRENAWNAEAFGVEMDEFGLHMCDVRDPFSQPVVEWQCDRLNEDRILEAMAEWSKLFWPDFACTYVFESVKGLPRAQW